MIDFKKNLYNYMNGSPGGVVGFFESISSILQDLGNDWTQHSKDGNDNTAKSWGDVFLEASVAMKNIASSLMKIRDEHDLREKSKELSEEDPAVLIQNFKNRVLKEAKNDR